METLSLDAGSGGRASQRLIHDLFLKYFDNPILNTMNDAALLELKSPLAFSTDSFVITPLEFKGGNIGNLAVHGTVNDVAMLGAKPKYISAACILEEGLDLALLERIVASMAQAAKEAGVLIATGDTKVVPKGACDKMFINTTGIGEVLVSTPPSGNRAKAGDVVIISGNLGDHALAIMAARENFSFIQTISSDCASLNHIIEKLVTTIDEVHVLRDPTRGGLATTLGEIAQQSDVDILLEEKLIPVAKDVSSACSLLGLDPLYLANEGKFICILPEEDAAKAIEIMQTFPEGKDAKIIGKVLEKNGKAKVSLKTHIGGERLLPMLEGAQLPRIC